jgi:hypothetical protein
MALLNSEEKHELFNKYMLNKKTCIGLSKMGPNYVPALYSDTPFPNYTSKDGSFTIQTDILNYLDGSLFYIDESFEIKMQWCGYASKLYDGNIGLVNVDERSKLSITINDILIDTMKEIPTFLVLYA